MGPIRNPNWSTSGIRVTLSYLVPTIYRTRGEHANHYATIFIYFLLICLIKISYCPSIYYLKTKINPKE